MSVAIWRRIFKKEKGLKSWRYFLLIEMAAVAGQGERFVFKCICFWDIVVIGKSVFVGLCDWMCKWPSAVGIIGGWGEPPKTDSTWNTFLMPPKRRPSPPLSSPKSVYYLPSYSGHMFMFIVLVCSSVKSHSERRGRREEGGVNATTPTCC